MKKTGSHKKPEAKKQICTFRIKEKENRNKMPRLVGTMLLYGLKTSRAPKGFSLVSFLALAWAKRDFGLALLRRLVSVQISKLWRASNILAGVLVSECVNLGCAGAHDVVGWGDVLLCAAA